jgi:branched-chain amino acid transport system substrate-binding protein
VSETKSLDHDKLAAYIHGATFQTVAGEIAYGKDGEWKETRQYLTQFQNVEPNNVDQFRDGSKQPILYPPQYKTGDVIYPYVDARKK